MNNTFPNIHISTNTAKAFFFCSFWVNRTTDDSEWLYIQHYSAKLFNRIKHVTQGVSHLLSYDTSSHSYNPTCGINKTQRDWLRSTIMDALRDKQILVTYLLRKFFKNWNLSQTNYQSALQFLRKLTYTYMLGGYNTVPARQGVWTIY